MQFVRTAKQETLYQLVATAFDDLKIHGITIVKPERVSVFAHAELAKEHHGELSIEFGIEILEYAPNKGTFLPTYVVAAKNGECFLLKYSPSDKKVYQHRFSVGRTMVHNLVGTVISDLLASRMGYIGKA